MTPNREQEFERRLKQGACFRDNAWKFDSVTKSKYFIVLSRDCSATDILVVLTTSQQAYYKDNPMVETDIVRFLPQDVSFFSQETIINCREVALLDRARMKARFVLKHIECLGDLPAGQAGRLLRTIRESRQIAKKMKKLICGDR